MCTIQYQYKVLCVACSFFLTWRAVDGVDTELTITNITNISIYILLFYLACGGVVGDGVGTELVGGEGVAKLDEGVVMGIGEDGDEEELEEVRLYSGYSEGVQ